MAKSPPFVGRRQELQRFDELLRSQSGQAIVVVGPRGMGKTLLVNRMAQCARDHPDLQCGAVRYEVTKTDTVDVTMSLMMDNAFEAAGVKEKSLDATPRNLHQWRALLNVLHIGDLVMSLRRDPQRNTRDQFAERLDLISKRLPQNGRVIFIVDPEKYMQPGSADDWRLVVRDLPEKIVFLFAQRPDGVLITNSDFMALENIRQVPDEPLNVLDEQGVQDLINVRASDLPVPIGKLREALTRYNGHPYAISAAMDLIADGRPLVDLPPDPTPERIAEAQWQQVCVEHGTKAMELFRALSVLEVAVPDEVVEAVAGLETIERQRLLANNYIAGLLREEANGRRIYHSLLADHVLNCLPDNEAKAYHRRAVDLYRGRLTAEVRPDALAAMRLPEHVRRAEGAEAFVSAFVDECTRPLVTLGLLDSAEGMSKQALKLVKKGTADEASLLGNLGLIFRTRGDLDPAEAMHRKALEIEEKLGRPEGKATDYGNLGLIYQARGDLDQAEKMHRTSLEIFEELGGLEGTATGYGNLGVIYMTRGDLDEAEKMHRKSLEIHEKLGRLEGMANQYANLGLIYKRRGDLDQAEAMHRKSLEVNERLGRLEGMANQFANLGGIHKLRGNLEEARGLWTQARDLYEKIGMPHMVAKVQNWLDELPEA